MDCKSVEFFLYHYLDNELAEQECLEIEEHIKHCPLCKNLYDFEFNFNECIKQSIQSEKIEVPIELKNKIIKAQKNRVSIGNIFTFKGALNVAIILVAVFVISNFSMGYSTLPDDYFSEDDKVEISSNNENKIKNWIKENKYSNFEPLNFSSELNITPLGIAFNKKRPAIIYHYKGNRVVYQNVPKKISTSGFEKYTIKGKTYFVKQKSNCSVAFWQNNEVTSLIFSKINKNELKDILKSIK